MIPDAEAAPTLRADTLPRSPFPRQQCQRCLAWDHLAGSSHTELETCVSNLARRLLQLQQSITLVPGGI